ncbi:WD40/YVTN/BNR-like repeat-containing protein [Aquabacterium sp.]|uniref:WD40/YVTN/BNR-like repeat-containing protein n=1 Tax=Aquabacterium sp. TaxID=1872578 RepID=UPI003BAF710B
MARQPSRAVLQSAALAGKRVVAVGERGIVVYSDDAGQSWRQAPVPVSVGLVALRFVDAQRGWAVGHGGVVLGTTDSGTSWVKLFDGRQAAQRLLEAARASADPRALGDAERLVAEGADKPFLDVHFFDERNGIVVGAYNLAFATSDAGRTWQPISHRLENPNGFHLYAVRARGDEVVIAGEQGLLLRSTDRGQSFTRLDVPYKGSFFTLELIGSNDIVIAGLRGNVLHSQDGGVSWTPVKVPVPVSFTASAVDAKGRLWLGNQAGMLYHFDGGQLTPVVSKLPPLTSLLPLPNGRALALSMAGAVPVNLERSK